jgi:hypothetical protein
MLPSVSSSLWPWLLALGGLPGEASPEAAPVALAPRAGDDLEVVLGTPAELHGRIEGRAPLDFWVADGNGPFENNLVHYSDGAITSVGPLQRTNGKYLGWTGDLVRIGERVYGVDVGARCVYVVDLETGMCVPVTPQIDERWKGLQSLAYDPQNDRLFSIDLNSAQLLEIRRGTGDVRPIQSPELRGLKGLRSLAFDEDLGLLFAADYGSDVLYVIDPEDGGLADTMRLPAMKGMRIEELCFFGGELYAIQGLLDAAGELNGGQLQRIDLHSGHVASLGPVIPDVSAHALLIESVPEDFYWSQVGGPAAAELEYVTLLETRAHFSAPGRYEFALTVLSASGPVSDRVAIDVRAAPE